jgi:hypothetical protein
MAAVEVRLHVSGVTTPVLLGSLTDPREHGVEGVAGDESRQLEVVQLFRSARVTVLNRQNRQENLTIRVVRLHASLADSLLHWLKHPADVPILADVEFVQDNAHVWLNAAGIPAVRRSQRIGLTTFFEYQLTGGSWANQRAT